MHSNKNGCEGLAIKLGEDEGVLGLQEAPPVAQERLQLQNTRHRFDFANPQFWSVST